MEKINVTINTKKDFQYNEAYKKFRTNLLFCGNDVKVVALTSCEPDEGKSEVSFSLSTALAELGKKVLLIDTDMRKSVMLSRYKINERVHGLSEYLSGQVSMEEAVYNTNIEGLDVVFAGPVPPNPAELLGNQLFTRLIEMGRENYDYVIIDTPPLGSVIDCAVIADRCDGIGMVVSAGSIKYRLAQMVKEQIETTGCRFLGVVLNKVKMGKKGYYNYYYYGYGKNYEYYHKYK